MTDLAKILVPNRLVQCKQAGAAGLAALLVLLAGCSATGGAPLPTVEVPAVARASTSEPLTPTEAATEIAPTATSSPPIPKGGLDPEIPRAPDLLVVLAVPRLDTDVTSVPLSEILFDTFGRTLARFVSLDRAEEELILGLRDAIAPVYRPVYGAELGAYPGCEDTIVPGNRLCRRGRRAYGGLSHGWKIHFW